MHLTACIAGTWTCPHLVLFWFVYTRYEMTRNNINRVHLKNSFFTSLMISAGMELIFFIEVHMMLCFGFLMKVLVSSLNKDFDFSHCPASKEAGSTQDTWPKLTKGMSHTIQFIVYAWEVGEWQGICQCIADSSPHLNVMLSNKSWGREQGRDMFWMIMFIFQRNHYTRWALLSWKSLNSCLLMRNIKWIPSFGLLTYIVLHYLSNCLYLYIFSILFTSQLAVRIKPQQLTASLSLVGFFSPKVLRSALLSWGSL